MLIIAMKCASALAPIPIFSNDCILPSSQLFHSQAPQHTHTPVPWKGTTRERCCRFKCTKARQRTCQGQTLVEPVGKDGREDGWCGPVGEAPCVICCGNGGKTHRKMATDPKRESTVYSPSHCHAPFGIPFRLCGFYNFKIYLRASGVFQPPQLPRHTFLEGVGGG